MTKDEVSRFAYEAARDCTDLAAALSQILASHIPALTKEHADDDKEMSAKLAISHALLSVAYWHLAEFPMGGLAAIVYEFEQRAILMPPGGSDGPGN